MNETLSQRGAHVYDLAELADGVHIAQFFEILSGKKIPTKIEAKPVNRIMKIQNCAIALKFLETDLGLRNPGCGAEGMTRKCTISHYAHLKQHNLTTRRCRGY